MRRKLEQLEKRREEQRQRAQLLREREEKSGAG
jgi:hypothetical protein